MINIAPAMGPEPSRDEMEAMDLRIELLLWKVEQQEIQKHELLRRQKKALKDRNREFSLAKWLVWRIHLDKIRPPGGQDT
jgi:hypothetical protein